MPTTGTVRSARLAPVIAITSAGRQRRISTRAKRNETAQTGLNASKPHRNPPQPGRPRAIRAQPQTRIVCVSGLFWASEMPPRQPGKAMTNAVAAGHHHLPAVP